MNRKKYLLVIDSEKNPGHIKLSGIFVCALASMEITAEVFDMAEPKALHEKFYIVRDSQPEVLISFDLAGFEMRTEMGNISFNMLPCRMCHLLFKPCASYGDTLREAFNFSMFFYTPEADLLPCGYPNIENPGSHELSESELTQEQVKAFLLGMRAQLQVL